MYKKTSFYFAENSDHIHYTDLSVDAV